MCSGLLYLQRSGSPAFARSRGARGPWGPRRASLTPRSPAGLRRPPPCPRPGSLLSASVGMRPRRRARAGGGCSHLAVLSPQVRGCCCYCCPGSRSPREPVSWMREEEGERTGREGRRLGTCGGMPDWSGGEAPAPIPYVPWVRAGPLPRSTPSSSGTPSPELLAWKNWLVPAWENRLVPAHRWGASGPGPT